MAVVRYSQGGTTVTLTGPTASQLRDAVNRIAKGWLDRVEPEAERVAAQARAAWYGPEGVTRRTGKSGDIQAITTVSDGEVRVTIGSADTRLAGKTGKPAIYYIHRPGPFSTIRRKATHEDFKSGAAKASPRGKRVAGRGVVEEPNPKASDGRHLLQPLIAQPARAFMRRLFGSYKGAIRRTVGGRR